MSVADLSIRIPLLAEGVPAIAGGVVSVADLSVRIPLLAEGVPAIAGGVVSATHGRDSLEKTSLII